jgi:hypothetical protein
MLPAHDYPGLEGFLWTAEPVCEGSEIIFEVLEDGIPGTQNQISATGVQDCFRKEDDV